MSEKDTQFARVVATHRHALLRYALRRLDDRSDAEDLVAETFVVAWRRFDDIPPRDQELFWLYGVAGRVLVNVLRGHQRSMRLEMRLALERERELDTQRYNEEQLEQLMWALSQVDVYKRQEGLVR